jgi:hypothetical protein
MKSGRNYSKSIESINRMILDAKEFECKEEELIDYLIDLIALDIKHDCLANVIYGRESFDLINCFPNEYIDEKWKKQKVVASKEVEVDFSKVRTFSIPWNRIRIPKNLAYLRDKKFCFQKNNHGAFYYPEVNICYVHNGRHLASIAISKNDGKIKAEKISLKPLFSNVRTDGCKWYSTHAEIELGEVSDFRFALLFELAKMKYK